MYVLSGLRDLNIDFRYQSDQYARTSSPTCGVPACSLDISSSICMAMFPVVVNVCVGNEIEFKILSVYFIISPNLQYYSKRPVYYIGDELKK